MEQWTTSIKASVNKDDPHVIIKAFKKGYQLEETYWTYCSLYLSSDKQGRGELVASKLLGYYDRRKAVIVQADASLRDLGTCLIQDGKPIAFASKSFTGVESRNANIERELLAIIFACIRFNTYLQGPRFTVQSDHKPLEMIQLKSMHNVPPRLQRMLLQLQKYDMEIKYKPGSEMLLADALS